MSMTLRPATHEDAPLLLDLLRHIALESDFMLWNAGEIPADDTMRSQAMATRIQNGSLLGFVGQVDGQNAGYVLLQRDVPSKIRHIAHLSMGVLAQYQGQGLGKKLMQMAQEQAKLLDLEKIELTVAASNSRAIGLYRAMGFEQEGVRRHALKLTSGVVMDELYMAYLVP